MKRVNMSTIPKNGTQSQAVIRRLQKKSISLSRSQYQIPLALEDKDGIVYGNLAVNGWSGAIVAEFRIGSQ